jgi:hypothetical protein
MFMAFLPPVLVGPSIGSGSPQNLTGLVQKSFRYLQWFELDLSAEFWAGSADKICIAPLAE